MRLLVVIAVPLSDGKTNSVFNFHLLLLIALSKPRASVVKGMVFVSPVFSCLIITTLLKRSTSFHVSCNISPCRTPVLTVNVIIF